MKKITLFVSALLGSTMLMAQSQNGIVHNPDGSTYIPATDFYETIPLRDMPLQTNEEKLAAAQHHQELEDRRYAMRPKFQKPNMEHKQNQQDPVVQNTMGVMTITAPLVNFDGQSDNFSCPNDPNGAVGPTQFVQMYNSSYAVYSKTGTLLKGPVDLKTIFTHIPGDDGDPVVLYDKFADRWFLSEFQASSTPCGFQVAISKTGDATGSYYVYYFTNSAWTASPPNFPDYLKFSMWTDGYYMTAN